jgi:hypothetical protein
MEEEDCVVCFEKTLDRTICNHAVCKNCVNQLRKNECPYCRKAFPHYKTFILSFVEFSLLFHRFYEKNDLYRDLLMGKDNHSILKNDVLFYVRSTDNFDDRGIEIRVFNIVQERSFHSSVKILEFQTVGLDTGYDSPNKKYRYSPISHQGQILENYIHQMDDEIFC